jgi:hypothetical protein
MATKKSENYIIDEVVVEDSVGFYLLIKKMELKFFF